MENGGRGKGKVKEGEDWKWKNCIELNCVTKKAFPSVNSQMHPNKYCLLGFFPFLSIFYFLFLFLFFTFVLTGKYFFYILSLWFFDLRFTPFWTPFSSSFFTGIFFLSKLVILENVCSHTQTFSFSPFFFFLIFFTKILQTITIQT